MSDAHVDANPAGPCNPWGLAASLAWGFAAIAAWIGAQLVLGHWLEDWFGVQGDELVGYAPFVAIVTVISAAVPVAVVFWAVRSAGCPVTDYLGLRLPSRRYFWIGVIALAIILPLVDLLSWLSGYAVTPEFVVDLYRTARESGAVLLLLIAIVVAAPVAEEIVFRGFLLPGLASSAAGPTGALVLTSAIWALLHAQYQPFYLIQIMLLGIVFGWLRLRSGSSVLTIALHGLLDLAALIQAAFLVEGGS